MSDSLAVGRRSRIRSMGGVSLLFLFTGSFDSAVSTSAYEVGCYGLDAPHPLFLTPSRARWDFYIFPIGIGMYDG